MGNCLSDLCTMKTRLKKSWKPMLNMISALKGLSECFVQWKEDSSPFQIP